MSTIRVHDKLIASAARDILAPLGFRQKGRSRLWFADHGWWLVVVEFQPSGWSRGSYLNVGAKWLWNKVSHWSFDFSFHPAARVSSFCEFETEEQFREASRGLARAAAAEALRLRAAFPDITAVADLLTVEVSGWPDAHGLFDAAAAAYLAGRYDEAVRLFTQLSAPQPDDYPGAHWLRELRRLAGELAAITGDDDRLFEVLSDYATRSREALRLPETEVRLPRGGIQAGMKSEELKANERSE